jgi:hypothetical protein
MASDPAALREIARVCLRRFGADAEKSAVQELFSKAGAAEELEKERRSAGALERFRRRKQRRAGKLAALGRGRESMLCPITMARPVDPVLLADGHVYERRAIDAWLSKSATSPLTREVLMARPYVPWEKTLSAHARYLSST